MWYNRPGPKMFVFFNIKPLNKKFNFKYLFHKNILKAQLLCN